MTDPIDSQDVHQRHCPMLGHEVGFGYCRAPGQPLPCRRVLDCWWETFDVGAFVRANWTAEQIDEILRPRQDKVTTLLSLIEQTRRVERS